MTRLAHTRTFNGPQADPTAQRAHLDAMARRLATRVQQLLATSTGTRAAPATMAAELTGNISPTDVRNARNLP